MSKLYVFIDTNIFLNFYSLDEKSIEELHKIIKLIDDEEIDLILPENVKDEFYKNRLKKIYSTIQNITAQDDCSIPIILKQYSHISAELDLTRKEVKRLKNQLLDKLMEDVKDVKLSADKVVEEIFEKATLVCINEEMIMKAEQRFKRNLPPKKSGTRESIGDAINWIALKEKVDSDIHIITDDDDYRDSLRNRNDSVNYYLSKEWLNEKNAKVYLYRGLKYFFDNKFEQYEFKIDEEKTKWIEHLIKSGGFSRTHYAISQLSKYVGDDFTTKEVNNILEAYVENRQIGWIAEDEDVEQFFKKITKNRERKLDQNIYAAVKVLYKKNDTNVAETESPFDEVPF